MKITLHTIKVRDLVQGFEDNDENGVIGYGGKLYIRPPYQREFVYSDSQQRTLSICHYVNGNFSHNMRFFTNLHADEKDAILNYELQVYFCEGTESEKLCAFKPRVLLAKLVRGCPKRMKCGG